MDREIDGLVGDGPMVRYGFAQLMELDSGLAIGLSRMPADALDWVPVTVGPDHHLVFSYVSQRVEFEGSGTKVVTPNEVVLCPSWQVYRRHDLYAVEEMTVFVAFTSECAARIGVGDELTRGTARLGPAPTEALRDAWRLAHLLRHIDPGDRSDLDHVERGLRLVTATLPGVGQPNSGVASRRPRTRRRHQELADAVREHLAVSFSDRTLPLERLAHEVGAAPQHLARVFGAETGRSIHAYRTDLRLRFVLARLPENEPLSDLAMEAGFASPSHLSDVFRSRLGVSPSRLRSQLRRGWTRPGSDDSGTNLEAGRQRRT